MIHLNLFIKVPQTSFPLKDSYNPIFTSTTNPYPSFRIDSPWFGICQLLDRNLKLYYMKHKNSWRLLIDFTILYKKITKPSFSFLQLITQLTLLAMEEHKNLVNAPHFGISYSLHTMLIHISCLILYKFQFLFWGFEDFIRKEQN